MYLQVVFTTVVFRLITKLATSPGIALIMADVDDVEMKDGSGPGAGAVSPISDPGVPAPAPAKEADSVRNNPPRERSQKRKRSRRDSDKIGDKKEAGQRPGRSGERPGRSGERERPGRSGERPGRSGERPGRSGERPGRSGERPGRSGERPGRSGERPTEDVRERRRRPSRSLEGARESRKGSSSPSAKRRKEGDNTTVVLQPNTTVITDGTTPRELAPSTPHQRATSSSALPNGTGTEQERGGRSSRDHSSYRGRDSTKHSPEKAESRPSSYREEPPRGRTEYETRDGGGHRRGGSRGRDRDRYQDRGKNHYGAGEGDQYNRGGSWRDGPPSRGHYGGGSSHGGQHGGGHHDRGHPRYHSRGRHRGENRSHGGEHHDIDRSHSDRHRRGGWGGGEDRHHYSPRHRGRRDYNDHRGDNPRSYGHQHGNRPRVNSGRLDGSDGPFRQDSTRSARSKRSDGPHRQNSSHNEDGDNNSISSGAPEIDIDLDDDEDEDQKAARLVEERKLRRQAIMAKHAGDRPSPEESKNGSGKDSVELARAEGRPLSMPTPFAVASPSQTPGDESDSSEEDKQVDKNALAQELANNIGGNESLHQLNEFIRNSKKEKDEGMFGDDFEAKVGTEDWGTFFWTMFWPEFCVEFNKSYF